jgi:Flp pilus assembly protein TadB
MYLVCLLIYFLSVIFFFLILKGIWLFILYFCDYLVFYILGFLLILKQKIKRHNKFLTNIAKRVVFITSTLKAIGELDFW